MFAQSTNTEEIPEASETNVDLDYEDNEDGGKLGRLFFTVTTTLILMILTMVIMMDVDYEENENVFKLGGRLFFTVITIFLTFLLCYATSYVFDNFVL